MTRPLVQDGLWGPPQPIPDPTSRRRYMPTNDLELVVMVIRSAPRASTAAVEHASDAPTLRDHWWARAGCGGGR